MIIIASVLICTEPQNPLYKDNTLPVYHSQGGYRKKAIKLRCYLIADKGILIALPVFHQKQKYQREKSIHPS